MFNALISSRQKFEFVSPNKLARRILVLTWGFDFGFGSKIKIRNQQIYFLSFSFNLLP